ncbi:MAG: hypothetical protein M0R38_08450 [Bacteroidia bacterium]|nr:hypothetical protein [Bacteroidia bacterium]
MKFQTSILLLFLSILLWASCRKDKFEQYDENKLGVDYFPLKPKMYHEYSVERITFDAFNQKSDTVHLIMRNEQDTFFKDNLGRTAMRYIQYTRNMNETQWSSERTYYYVSQKTHIESVVENKRSVILTFPVLEESVWDLNTYNKEPQYLLIYDKKLESYNNGFIQSNQSIEITRFGRDLPFEVNSWKEIYAVDIGLVSKEYTNIDLLDNNYPSGTKEKIELISYGFK